MLQFKESGHGGGQRRWQGGQGLGLCFLGTQGFPGAAATSDPAPSPKWFSFQE
jgi:hypothetical protein